jgi:SAM-dependent methyltransferase
MPLNARLGYSSEPAISLNEVQSDARRTLLEKYQSGEIQTQDVPCYCGDTGGQEIALKDRYGFPVRTVLCMRCGLLRTSPRMTPASAERFYKEYYRTLYDGAWGGPEARFEHNLRLGERMISKIPLLVSKVQTVFDVGCAAGGMLQAFKNIGKTTAGCDMDRRYLEYGLSKGLHLVEGGGKELLEDFGAPADLVILSHVLEHFFDLKRELEEVVDTVRPGGFVLILVPGLDTVATAYRGDLLLYLQNAHNYHFSAPVLRYVLESVGVKVLAADEEGVALIQRPEAWSKTDAPILNLPASAGMENMARLLRLEAGVQAAAGKL